MTKASLLSLLFILSTLGFAQAREIALSEFIQKLEPLYYDLEREGCKGYRCDLRSDVLDRLIAQDEGKDGPANEAVKILNDVQFTMEYDLRDTQIGSAELPRPEDRQVGFIMAFMGMLHYGELSNQVSSWATFDLPDLLRQLGKETKTVLVEELEEGYKISAKEKDWEFLFSFSPDHRLRSIRGTVARKRKFEFTVDYEDTPKGWRLRSGEMLYKGNFCKATVSYHKVKGLYLPQTMRITSGHQDSRTEPSPVSISFSNYVLAKGKTPKEVPYLSPYARNRAIEQGLYDPSVELARRIPGSEMHLLSRGFQDWVDRTFEFQLGLGSGWLMDGGGFSQGTGVGLSLDAGVGVRLSRLSSLMLYMDLGLYRSTHPSLGEELNLRRGMFSLVVKHRLNERDVRPYLFAGIGGGSQGYRIQGADETDSFNEVSLLGGMGVEIPLHDMLYLFIQGGVEHDIHSSYIGPEGYPPSPGTFLPLKVGIVIAD